MMLFPTQYHVSATEHYNKEPKMVIPPAHTEVTDPIESLDGWDDRPYDFGFVNAIPHKGLLMMMKLIGRMPDKKFLIKRGNYGNQQMVDYMDKWFDNVTVAGWYDDMNDYYRSCKSILYPSLQEGFGMVSYEAMANGCLTFANSHPVMLSACPKGPIYIDAYPEETKLNYYRYQVTTPPEKIDSDMDLASEWWEDEIRDVLSNQDRIDQHQKAGLEAILELGAHIEKSYNNFFNFVLANYK
jgi:glycosyltransferase involved in cell wall biosynthesis